MVIVRQTGRVFHPVAFLADRATGNNRTRGIGGGGTHSTRRTPEATDLWRATPTGRNRREEIKRPWVQQALFANSMS